MHQFIFLMYDKKTHMFMTLLHMVLNPHMGESNIGVRTPDQAL